MVAPQSSEGLQRVQDLDGTGNSAGVETGLESVSSQAQASQSQAGLDPGSNPMQVSVQGSQSQLGLDGDSNDSEKEKITTRGSPRMNQSVPKISWANGEVSGSASEGLISGSSFPKDSVQDGLVSGLSASQDVQIPVTHSGSAPGDLTKVLSGSAGSVSLGAWAKPIQLSPDRPAGSLSRSDWPCLSASPSNHVPRKKDQHAHTRGKVTISTHQSLPSPLSDEDKKRFPWSAKMDQSVRNLYRATTPIYLEDGTPQVTIPSSVLLQGLENQKEYVLGQFYRCKTPSGGLVNAVVNRIWGKNCRIFSRSAGISTYLFHIPDESTRSWVLRRGLWHVDDCMMFVAPWTPAGSLVIPEISTVPVWVTLKNIPYQLYSIPGVSHIASGLGAPMLTYKPRLDPLFMGEAKIMVEVELNKPFPHRVAAKDDCGTVNMVDVEYAWIPTKCGNCGQLGHKKSRCLDLDPNNQAPISNTKDFVSSTASTIPITVAQTRLESDFTSPLDQAPTMAALDNASVVSSPPPNATVNTCTPAVQIHPVTPTIGHKSGAISTASEPAIASPITTSLIVPVDAHASSTTSPKDFVSPHFTSETDNHGDSPRASEFVYSSCEDTMDIHQLVEETLQRKSIRNIKPTLKAKELARSANKGRRGKGRRGRSHR